MKLWYGKFIVNQRKCLFKQHELDHEVGCQNVPSAAVFKNALDIYIWMCTTEATVNNKSKWNLHFLDGPPRFSTKMPESNKRLFLRCRQNVPWWAPESSMHFSVRHW